MSQTEVRDHKVKCKYGVADYLRFYKKNVEDPEDDTTYRNVLKDYLRSNKNLVSYFGYIYNLPERLGRVEIRKTKKEVYLDKDGTIVNKLPINWKATNELWANNEKAKEKKIKIRYTNEHTNGFVFRPLYIKKTANYKNKSVYKMLINREMRRNTFSGIMNKKIDAFLMGSEKR